MTNTTKQKSSDMKIWALADDGFDTWGELNNRQEQRIGAFIVSKTPFGAIGTENGGYTVTLSGGLGLVHCLEEIEKTLRPTFGSIIAVLVKGAVFLHAKDGSYRYEIKTLWWRTEQWAGEGKPLKKRFTNGERLYLSIPRQETK